MKKLLLLTAAIVLLATVGCAPKMSYNQQRAALKALIQDAHDACNGESTVNVIVQGRAVKLETFCVKRRGTDI